MLLETIKGARLSLEAHRRGTNVRNWLIHKLGGVTDEEAATMVATAEQRARNRAAAQLHGAMRRDIQRTIERHDPRPREPSAAPNY